MGSRNVVLEGLSDQRIIVAAIQKFGDPSRIDLLLDLNKTTFVSADGAPNVPTLVEKSVTGCDRPPVVVVLLDGDPPGQLAAQDIEGKETWKKTSSPPLIKLILVPVWGSPPIMLEDIIPPSLWRSQPPTTFKTDITEDSKWQESLAPIKDNANGDTPVKHL